MAKISQVSAKYIINATIDIDGVVDRPDVIGAVFGQTEGLLGTELELRELQRSGRIGRIEVQSQTKGGKTSGTITIPSSLDMAETAIIGAAIEVIERIGPCNAKIKVTDIEDVRVSKRQQVIERAKALLRELQDKVIPDSQELSDEVAQSVRQMEITSYGKDKLPAGPSIDEAEEVILVEGRADVLNMLKHGFKNVVGMNGSNVPQTVIDLCKEKTVIVFVDGDRGGDLQVKALLQTAEIDFVTKAPDGKEVEELTKKEIHKCLRAKIAAEQAKHEFANVKPQERVHKTRDERRDDSRGSNKRENKRDTRRSSRKTELSAKDKESFKEMLEDLVGTRGAYIVDDQMNILGKVPTTELAATVKSLGSGVHAIIMDGVPDKDIIESAEKNRVKVVVAAEPGENSNRVAVLTSEQLE
ncbi:DNA primase [Candidatus Woesearchaeota archaeon]|nr:MAG: DNA primase [Candidatus Woesearchaeota archaeon]